ncbi:Uncharacterised protein [uncultured archaeon]|nr:Uncharacterised protein [uncultured archaeon]
MTNRKRHRSQSTPCLIFPLHTAMRLLFIMNEKNRYSAKDFHVNRRTLCGNAPIMQALSRPKDLEFPSAKNLILDYRIGNTDIDYIIHETIRRVPQENKTKYRRTNTRMSLMIPTLKLNRTHPISS